MPHRAIGFWFRSTRRILNRLWPLVALLCLAAFCLSPALGTGYWAEDIYYSAMVPANPILKDTTWFADTLDSIRHSMLVGRFYPITPIITAVAFIVFRNVVFYKAYIIGVTLLDVALFHLLARRLTGQRGFAALATALVVSLFQFRLTVDPILAYYGQIQWVTAAFLGSLIALRRYLEGGKPAWLTLSAFGYLFCTLSYEMTYTLVAIPVFLIFQARPGWRQGEAMARPFVLSAVCCAGMTVLIRWLHPTDNYVHQTDYNPFAALGSLAHQVSAGLPLSYYLGDPLSLFAKGRDLEAWVDWLLQPGVILVFVATVGLTFRSLQKARRASTDAVGPVSDATLVGLGILLAVCPAILTAISPYHRNYLSFGVGWIGVMVQYYGVALVLAIAIWRLVGARPGGGPFAFWKCLLASASVASILAVTYRANIEVATAMNAPPGTERYRQFVGNHGASWHLQRMNLEAALNSGVMSEVPSGSRVQLVNLYPYWHDSLYGQFFYTKQTRKRIETLPTQIPTRLLPNAPLFRVRDSVRNRDIGLVVVTPSLFSPFGLTLTPPPPDAGRVFVRHPAFRSHQAEMPTMLLVGQSLSGAPGNQPPARRPFRLGQDLTTIRTGPGWALFALDAPELQVDPDSLLLVDDPIQVASWMGSVEKPARIEARVPQNSSVR